MGRPADELDYFSDPEVLLDPYSYFDELRAMGPVHHLKCRDMYVVTGHKEATEILLNHEDFSSVSAVVPIQPLPFEPKGDDISGQIEAHRSEFLMSDILVSADGARHSAFRSLMTVLFTPSRMRAMEDYMASVAADLVGKAVAAGQCEVVRDLAVPYVTMVIADLLGVPAEDRQTFRDEIDSGPPIVGAVESRKERQIDPFHFMVPYFHRYIEERREQPRDDVLTEFANARYPDGSLPSTEDVIKNATFLFGAGQDTSAKLLGNAMRYVALDPELQAQLRADRSLIAGLLEEVLRLEGSTKATFRLAKRTTTLGGVVIPAGKSVIVALGGANRDPARWNEPNTFRLDRPRVKEHLAFGRGAHTCVGNPLARAEIRVIIDRLFEQTSSITLDEEYHGPAGNRRFSYEPTYIIRGLEQLRLKLEPA